MKLGDRVVLCAPLPIWNEVGTYGVPGKTHPPRVVGLTGRVDGVGYMNTRGPLIAWDDGTPCRNVPLALLAIVEGKQ